MSLSDQGPGSYYCDHSGVFSQSGANTTTKNNLAKERHTKKSLLYEATLAGEQTVLAIE